MNYICNKMLTITGFLVRESFICVKVVIEFYSHRSNLKFRLTLTNTPLTSNINTFRIF